MSPNRLWMFIAAMSLLIGASHAPADPAVDVLATGKAVTIRRGDQTLSFASAKEAVAAAKSGDVITLGAGTHAGPLVLGTSGVSLIGEPGARVNANVDSWKPQWTKEPQYGPHAYSSPIPWQPVTMAIDQRVMIDAEESRGGLSVHEAGAGRNGRMSLQGVFTWLKASNRVVVSFSDDLDPAQHVIEAAQIGTAAVTISADHCLVENLILTGGRAGVLFKNANDSTVQKCLIAANDIGVYFVEGANRCRAVSCDITWNEDSLHGDCDPATADVGNDVWHAHKKYGTYDKWAVLAEASGENNEIAINYIYNVWDGIEANDSVGKNEIASYYREKVLTGTANTNRGLKVHHNRIDLTLDDALEPGGVLPDNQWYGNVVSRSRCETRFKTITMGPFFYYNNVLLDSADGLRLYKSMPASADVYIFNNLVKFKTGVLYHEMDQVAWDDPWLKANLPRGTPGFYIYNNIFLSDAQFNNNTGGGKAIEPNFHGDYNLFTCDSTPSVIAAGIDKDSLFSAAPKFANAESADFHLAADSAGRGAGADLSKLSIKPALPALLQANAANKDIGLIDADPEKAPNGPVSGLWMIAEAPLHLGERDITKYSVTPIRWVGGKSVDFLLTDLPMGESLPISFVRSDSTASAKFKVTVLNETGETLTTVPGSAANKDGFDLDVPLKGAKKIKIHIDDKDGQWRLDAGAAKIGMDATTEIGLRKFDGVPFVVLYPINQPTGAITVTLKSKYGGASAQVIRPDGTSEKLTSDAVDTHGEVGVFKIAVSFVKEAQLKIDGPSPAVYLDKNADPVPLRPMWGKPAY